MLLFVKQKLHNGISDLKFPENLTGVFQEPLAAYSACFNGEDDALKAENRIR